MSGRRLAGRVAGVLTGRMAARGAQFVTFFLLARSLSPADFGWYGLFTTSVLLGVLIGSLGLRQACAYQLGQGRLSHAEALGAMGVSWPVLSLVAAGAVVVAVGNPLPTPGWTPIILISLVATLGAMGVMLMQGLLLGLGRTGRFALSDSVMAVLLLAMTAGLWVSGHLTLYSVLMAVAASQLIAGIATFFMASPGAGRPQIVLAETPALLAYGFGFALNLFLITLSVRLSLYLIEMHGGAELAGQFFAGVRLNDLMIEAATALGLVLFSDTVRSGSQVETLRSNLKIAAWLLWLFMAGAVLLAAIAPWGVPFLLGAEYAPAGQVLMITAFMVGPTAATKVIYPSLAGLGRPWLGTPAIGLSLAVNWALSLILIPRYGLAGASVALVVSQWLLMFAYIAIVGRHANSRWQSALIPQFFRRGG